MERLGKNGNSYRGATIPVYNILAHCEYAAYTGGWIIERIRYSQSAYFIALKRIIDPSYPNIYISSGIHGDEPAGPITLYNLLKKDILPRNCNLWIVPCINHKGFMRNSRVNENGVDLNRDYYSKKTNEIRAHVEWLRKQPEFDLSLCIHEDWEANGFYVYEMKREGHPSLAREIIKNVSRVFPIDTSDVIDSYPAKRGVIQANNLPLREIRGWPEAIYLHRIKKSSNYTLETGSDFYLDDRVKALSVGIETAVRAFLRN